MGQSIYWIKFDMTLTCCLDLTFVIADFLVDKACRPQKPLLVYALYLNVDWLLTFVQQLKLHVVF